MIHRFVIPVNCSVSKNRANGELLPDKELFYNDNGFIILPDQYTEKGNPTRLVIICHGAGGTVTTDDSQVEHHALALYLVANGYAVMDVNGLPEEYAKEKGIDIRNNIGSPIAMRSYVSAYHYCMDNFNLKPEVFIHGASMGGISSTNLVLGGYIPVIAHTAFCPVLDTYNEIFLKPWSGGLPKEALGKIYGLETDSSGEYIYDSERLVGYNPAGDIENKDYPVPVKFWHCEDDKVVSCEVTRQFVNRVCEKGGNADLRTFPHGGHEPQLVGEKVPSPSGVDTYNGEEIDVTAAVEEAFVWLTNFER